MIPRKDVQKRESLVNIFGKGAGGRKKAVN